MAQIGTFTRGDDGILSGTIRTLSLNVKARFVPAEASSNEKAPALRVLAGTVEIGAAWKRTSKDNSVYHSVKLDDPSFPAPIFANLVEVEGGYALVWSRCAAGRGVALGAAPPPLAPGIMRSAHPLCGAEILVLSNAAPHNAQLRIIRLGLTRYAGVVCGGDARGRPAPVERSPRFHS
jgi:uncharacterized protein (DUF736 family)